MILGSGVTELAVNWMAISLLVNVAGLDTAERTAQ